MESLNSWNFYLGTYVDAQLKRENVHNHKRNWKPPYVSTTPTSQSKSLKDYEWTFHKSTRFWAVWVKPLFGS